ncbi:MAG: hypothetical protein HQL63_14640 [Magnetococcales bacterium]|nr:hypothetical protein [Magnetococcales bacterium]MBF0321969.1 hypothetical protein [Magnetococcales bacterium]
MTTQHQLPEPFTLEFLASELPESIAQCFIHRPAANARFVVTIEPAQTEEEKLATLRRDIQEGVEDANAGRIIDGATIFAELKAKFPIV